jgi:hypothetical protein
MQDRKRAVTGRDDQIRPCHHLRQFVALSRVRHSDHAVRLDPRAGQGSVHRVGDVRASDEYDAERGQPTRERFPLAG